MSRADELRQRLEVVAAFQHGGDLRAQRGRPACELTEARFRHEHSGERVVLVRVEAGGYENEVWSEGVDGGLDELLERAQVVLVRRAGRERDVQEGLALVV